MLIEFDDSSFIEFEKHTENNTIKISIGCQDPIDEKVFFMSAVELSFEDFIKIYKSLDIDKEC